jgi:succinate-acetate transporter protein
MQDARPVPFADPTPLGLIGLAVGCAALVPVALGLAVTPAALSTAAIFCLLFGAGGQFLAGLIALANRNLHGGTLLTAFSFNWVVNWWMLDRMASGLMPDHLVLLAVDLSFLVIFAVLTYAFGFFSKLLLVFLLDVVLLYVVKVVQGFTGPHPALGLLVVAFTIALGLLALWIAFAILVNPVAGRRVFPFPGPAFTPAPQGTTPITRPAE